MDLNDKIKQILVDKSISPSHFADEIGVQRSSISHILAGRNKPSLDIIQKIVRRYPDLGMDWILDEDEWESAPSMVNSYSSERYGVKDPVRSRNPNGLDLREKKSLNPTPVYENVSPSESEPLDDKLIERILIFYKDGTFKQYKPE
jgi:transcriptional regulator with XRE-family HTH domain